MFDLRRLALKERGSDGTGWFNHRHPESYFKSALQDDSWPQISQRKRGSALVDPSAEMARINRRKRRFADSISPSFKTYIGPPGISHTCILCAYYYNKMIQKTWAQIILIDDAPPSVSSSKNHSVKRQSVGKQVNITV